MTLSGIKSVTYRLVVQCPNQLGHQKNTSGYNEIKNKMTYNWHAIYYVVCGNFPIMAKIIASEMSIYKS